MKKTLLLAISLLTLSCSKNEIANPLYKSECNITNPKNEFKWISQENYIGWSNLKGSYLYIYYGFLEKSDSPYLSKNKYFDDKNPREIVIVRISKEKRDKIELNDWLLLYTCEGKMISEGWVKEWTLLPEKLKKRFIFDVQQL
jgi:hypothetical protein